MRTRTFTAPKGYVRADICLSEQLEGYTRSAVKKLFEGGLVQVNGKSAKPAQGIAEGDEICCTLPDPVEISARPEDIPLDIVYEDDDIAVINKQQGLTVHAGNGHLSGTLVNALLYRLRSLSSINGVVRPGIVHRIDKDTSGLLVVAKNDAAHLSLSDQIAKKTCRREYLALCEGILKENGGTVDTFIGRHPTDRVKMAVLPEGKGRRAVTHYKVVKRYNKGYTLVHFTLETGRTHQIRVHCRHLGHPIVGDSVYGIKKQKFELNGQLLHAFRLTLSHPKTGKRMTFEAPVPAYFQRVLDLLEKGGAGS